MFKTFKSTWILSLKKLFGRGCSFALFCFPVFLLWHVRHNVMYSMTLACRPHQWYHWRMLAMVFVVPQHYGLWIGLGGSLSIWVKIFISVIWLKLYRISQSNIWAYITSPYGIFLGIFEWKKAPKVDSLIKIAKFQQKSINF